MPGTQERYERLLEAGLALSSELSLPAILQRIVELAAGIAGARYGALGVLGPDGRITEFVTTGVTPEQRAAIGHIPVGRGILGVLIDEAVPLRLRDIATDPRSVGFPPNHPPMRSFLGAPVTARGQVFGNIYLTEKQGAAEFDAEDERALVLLAAQAGVAVENARLYEEAAARARRLEALRAITVAILAGSDDAGEPVGLVARHARELVGADLATLAVPAGEGELVVEAADGLAGKAGDLIQLTREALSNVSRHAGAATCRLSLYRTEESSSKARAAPWTRSRARSSVHHRAASARRAGAGARSASARGPPSGRRGGRQPPGARGPPGPGAGPRRRGSRRAARRCWRRPPGSSAARPA
jgi:GAF domain-containing protein